MVISTVFPRNERKSTIFPKPQSEVIITHVLVKECTDFFNSTR